MLDVSKGAMRGSKQLELLFLLLSHQVLLPVQGLGLCADGGCCVSVCGLVLWCRLGEGVLGGTSSPPCGWKMLSPL